MKWEKPVVKELDVSMTANGWFDTTVETFVLFNDKDRTPSQS